MKKFMLLYIGPPLTGSNIGRAPLTQAALGQWGQRIGSALVDQGTLFGPDGKGVLDNGLIEGAPWPVHGYSIVEALDMAAAIRLIEGHPFLANGNQSDYEIEILELLGGDMPTALASTPSPVPPAFQNPAPPPPPDAAFAPSSPNTSTLPEAPANPTPGTTQRPGELTIPHDETNDQASRPGA